MHQGFGPAGATCSQQRSLQVMSDSNWEVGPSIAGFVMMLGGAAVAWTSKKQAAVAISSTEAETYAAAAATAETVWGRGLLAELGWPQLEATPLWVDNTGALNLAQNAESLGRSRHIARRANFLQKAGEQGAIKARWITTMHMLADLLTKPLDRKRFIMLRERIMGTARWITGDNEVDGAEEQQQANLGAAGFVRTPDENEGARGAPALGRGNWGSPVPAQPSASSRATQERREADEEGDQHADKTRGKPKRGK